MKINLLILTILVALAALWTSLSNQSSKAVSEEHIQQERVTDFTYSALKDVQSNLHTHQGKVIFLHFWATWCAPCLLEFPALMELARKHGDELIVLAVSTDTRKSDIERFLKKLKSSVPTNVHIIQDDTDKTITEKLYGTLKLPETYVIRPDLRLHEKISGAEDNWDSAAWHKTIETLTQDTDK